MKALFSTEEGWSRSAVLRMCKTREIQTRFKGWELSQRGGTQEQTRGKQWSLRDEANGQNSFALPSASGNSRKPLEHLEEHPGNQSTR